MGKLIYSTEDRPDVPPIEVMRQAFAASAEFDGRPLDDGPIRYRAELSFLPDMMLVRASVSAVETCTRMGDQHLVVGLPLEDGRLELEQRGETVSAVAGEAVLYRPGEIVVTRAPVATEYLALGLLRERLAPLLARRDTDLAGKIEAGTPGLDLLRAYLEALNAEAGAAEAKLASDHVYNLTAFVLGATDAARYSAERGLMAARFQSAKTFIHQHLLDPQLDEKTLAVHLGVSQRYVRKLFALEQTSVTSFVRQERLRRAHHLLRTSEARITDIAFDCGFNSIATFNRLFRRQFGLKPGDVQRINICIAHTS